MDSGLTNYVGTVTVQLDIGKDRLKIRNHHLVIHLRPTISALLCSFLVLGQAPAWLHVASCDNHAELHERGVRDHDIASTDHCCHDHDSDDSESGDSADEHPDHEHDSDHCAVCLSLIGPNGWLDQFDAPTLVETAPHWLSIRLNRAAQTRHISLPLPRGPPLV